MKPQRKLAAFIAVFGLAGLMSASAATVAFTNEFDSSGFTNTGGFPAPAGGVITSTAPVNATTTSWGTEQFTNIENTSFTMTTTFTISSRITGTVPGDPTGTTTVGFALFAQNSGVPDATNNPFLLADVVTWSSNIEGGTVRLLGIGIDDGPNASVEGSGTLALDTSYTLRLVATNIGTDTYDLTLDLLDADTEGVLNTVSVSGFEGSGEYFGIRSRTNIVPGPGGTGTGSTVTSYNDFNVIPEPSTGLLLSLVGVTLLAHRRR